MVHTNTAHPALPPKQHPVYRTASPETIPKCRARGDFSGSGASILDDIRAESKTNCRRLVYTVLSRFRPQRHDPERPLDEWHIYVFSSDHSVPSSVSLGNFRYTTDLAKELGRY